MAGTTGPKHHTRTRDSHWHEAGPNSPYRSFPDKPYFPPLVTSFQSQSVVFIEKSRDLMLSWFCVGFFTHAAMTIEQREVLFQSHAKNGNSRQNLDGCFYL